MKAITLHQPWASLVALGVKSIETRSWSTNYRGPLAVHASLRRPEYQHLGPYAVEDWWNAVDVRHVAECDCEHDEIDPRCGRRSRSRMVLTRLAAHEAELPLGAIVATCTLVDCLPIVTPGTNGYHDLVRDNTSYVERRGDALDRVEWHGSQESWFRSSITAQLPFGDYTPGRFAWLLDDVKPCDPVPARGRQGLWEWESDLICGASGPEPVPGIET